MLCLYELPIRGGQLQLNMQHTLGAHRLATCKRQPDGAVPGSSGMQGATMLRNSSADSPGTRAAQPPGPSKLGQRPGGSQALPSAAWEAVAGRGRGSAASNRQACTRVSASVRTIVQLRPPHEPGLRSCAQCPVPVCRACRTARHIQHGEGARSRLGPPPDPNQSGKILGGACRVRSCPDQSCALQEAGPGRWAPAEHGHHEHAGALTIVVPCRKRGLGFEPLLSVVSEADSSGTEATTPADSGKDTLPPVSELQALKLPSDELPARLSPAGSGTGSQPGQPGPQVRPGHWAARALGVLALQMGWRRLPSAVRRHT